MGGIRRGRNNMINEYTDVAIYGDRVFTEIVIDVGSMLQIDISHLEVWPVFDNICMCQSGVFHID